jgi:hypothetical protein
MMPPFSCSTPGSAPGVSTTKTKGVLYESQNLMNAVALSEASVSIAPERYMGWLAITPTGRPSTRAKAVIIACPRCAPTSNTSPSSKIRSRISIMS